MDKKWKYTALGALIGATVAGVLASPQLIPAAIADEQPLRTLLADKQDVLDMLQPDRHDDLFKPNWDLEEYVSTEVTNAVTVRKISGGKTTFVTIATTPSGVYSSDALTSKNIRYPGIHAEKQTAAAMMAVLAGGGWLTLQPVSAGSFAYVVPNKHGHSVITDSSSCHFIDGSVIC